MKNVRQNLDLADLKLSSDLQDIKPKPIEHTDLKTVSREAVKGTPFSRSVQTQEIPTRRRNTNRTQQFTTRLTPEIYRLIYELADKKNSRAIADVIDEGIIDLAVKYGLIDKN